MALSALIDKTYFTKPPKYLSLLDTKADTRLEGIVLFYQEILGRWLLGDLEWYKFEFEYTTPYPQKWIDFVDGKIYIVDGKSVQWKGFKDLLTYFVYCFFLMNENTKTVHYGEVKMTQENAVNVSPINKMVEVWNKGIEFYGDDWKLLFVNDRLNLDRWAVRNSAYWNNFNELDFHYDCRRAVYINEDIEKYRPTAYNFLYNHYESNYIDWRFTTLKKINIFGI